MRNSLALLIMVTVLVAAGAACAAEPVDWTGWYAGIFGGHLNGKLTSNEPGHFETTGEFDDNGPIFGIQGGYNGQNANDWVFGGELIIPLYLKNGEAVDTEFFPDEDPRVTYKTDYKFAVLLGGRAGKALGKWLPYAFVAVGFVKNDGLTVNLDNDNNYSPGSQQVASATHIAYQFGVGGDVQLSEVMVLGARVLGFNANQQEYAVPWNEGENNKFGMNSLLLQLHLNYRF